MKILKYWLRPSEGKFGLISRLEILVISIGLVAWFIWLVFR